MEMVDKKDFDSLFSAVKSVGEECVKSIYEDLNFVSVRIKRNDLEKVLKIDKKSKDRKQIEKEVVERIKEYANT